MEGTKPTISDTKVPTTDRGCSALGEVVHDVLAWRNPVTTATLLAAINVAFFLFAVMGHSALSLLAYSALFIMGAGFLLSVFVKSSPDVGRVEIVSRQQVEDAMLCVYDNVNDSAATVRDLVLWHEPKNSLKVVFAVVGCGWLASWISFTTLAFFATWILFTLNYTTTFYADVIGPTIRPHLKTLYASIPRMSALKKAD